MNPPWWVNSHIKDTGMLSRNFEKKKPKNYQDAVLWAWLEMFSTLRATNSKTHIIEHFQIFY